MNKECEGYRSLLQDYLNKNLSQSEIIVVEQHLCVCEKCFDSYFSLVEKKVEEDELLPYMGGRPAWGPLAWRLDKKRDLVEEISRQALASEASGNFEPILIKRDNSQATSVLFLEMRIGAKLKEKGKNVSLYTTATKEFLLSKGTNEVEERSYLIIDALSQFPDLTDILLVLKKKKIVLIGSIEHTEATNKDVESLSPKIFSLKMEDLEVERFSKWFEEGFKEEKEELLKKSEKVENLYLNVCLFDAVDLPIHESFLKKLIQKDGQEFIDLIKDTKGLIYEVENSSQERFFCTRFSGIARAILEQENIDLNKKYQGLIETVDPTISSERMCIPRILLGLIRIGKRRLVRSLIMSKADEKFRRECIHLSELLSWARVYHQLKQYEKAKEAFDEAKNRFPNNIFILHAYAKMMADWRKYREAKELFKEAESIEPDNIYIYHAWGDMEAGRTHRHWPDAITHFEKVLEIDHENIYALVSIGNIRVKTDKLLEEAEKLFKEALKIDRDNLYALNSLGEMEKKRLNYIEADKYFQKVMAIDPYNIPTINALGNMEKERGWLNKAEEHFREALKIDPENIHSLHSLTEIMVEKESDEETERLFKEILLLDPSNIHTYIAYAVMKAKREKFNEAERLLEKAKEIDKENPYVYNVQADMYSRQGKDEEAEELFEKALKISGEDRRESVPIYNSRAKMWARRGEFENAREDINASLKILVWRRQEGFDYVKEPLPRIDRIITLNTAAEIEIKTGDFVKAKDYLKEALRLDKDNAYTHRVFGKMLKIIGKEKEAEEHLKIAKGCGLL